MLPILRLRSITLIRVLEKIGFGSRTLDMVWKLEANNWYSLHEVLRKALNHLFYNYEFKSFGLPKFSDQLNLLAYAYDTIIFASVWKSKLLSFGGKPMLINHELQSIPIYLLSTIFPTKGFIYDIHRIFAKFLWNFKDGERLSTGFLGMTNV
ncbi:hypothetical protein H5410_002889 [Solanum commersonii]|uniref:Uncharacterized protein n=1 Tax=Solanum commersonii TaxID=4109 RepID=A0A9J6B3F6_SOLCO|nr:hypothetical protein H5410_002889 [Solanum commersonii]